MSLRTLTESLQFSGKELDDETGYSYFGARYYDPNISIWLSVDQLSDKYPSVSPYAYVANNPIKLITHCLEGKDVREVQCMVGHRHVSSTVRYQR